MAKLSPRGEGKWGIHFNQSRSNIYLSGKSREEAETWRLHVNHLIDCHEKAAPYCIETSEWLDTLADKEYEKLVKLELCKPRLHISASKVPGLCEVFLQSKAAGCKPASIEVYKKVTDNVVAFFGDRWVQSINPTDADRFWTFLITNANRHTGKGLSPTTATKRMNIVREIWGFASKERLVDLKCGNPFAKQSKWGFTEKNDDRLVEVSSKSIKKIINACESTEGRLLIAMGRWGGLRIPSEVRNLLWKHVDFKESKITLLPPKTARYAGKGKRMIPIFPEIKPLLNAQAQEAEQAGLGLDDYVFQTHRFANSGSAHTFLKAAALKVGILPWPKLWQNLRSTRETELIAEFGGEVACKWIGNSVKVAVQHYLNVNKSTYKKADSWETPDVDDEQG